MKAKINFKREIYKNEIPPIFVECSDLDFVANEGDNFFIAGGVKIYPAARIESIEYDHKINDEKYRVVMRQLVYNPLDKLVDSILKEDLSIKEALNITDYLNFSFIGKKSSKVALIQKQ